MCNYRLTPYFVIAISLIIIPELFIFRKPIIGLAKFQTVNMNFVLCQYKNNEIKAFYAYNKRKTFFCNPLI